MHFFKTVISFVMNFISVIRSRTYPSSTLGHCSIEPFCKINYIFVGMSNHVPAQKCLRSTYGPKWIFKTDRDSVNNLKLAGY